MRKMVYYLAAIPLNRCSIFFTVQPLKYKYILYTMEDGRMMLLHSAVIGVLLYLVMVFVLGQRQVVAENRSILLAALALVYMILFGHGLPKSINKNLF